ncbi:hypothetical protein pEaSNUABM5_00329 [Erwinia phage pEa_SNUABM_5]|uniref:Uncharacterized protein n=1 Tax=Erwinia phage pEa_SNUABM_5 TaxID=2797313 RepID=A0A7T8EPT8_9CAUD|nr:hypothetical protein MPK73_gp329 [Erwinia phage pEa_SNUABM_5]QQO90471.1 hypothetical protein pEaSNUABM5_00329 [Erwinia phage pEa_SNUABM_5]
MTIQTPAVVAESLVHNAQNYFGIKGKSCTRFSTTEKNILLLSGHNRYLPDDYVDQLKRSFHDIDWLMFKVGTDDYAFLSLSQTKNWSRLSMKYLDK